MARTFKPTSLKILSGNPSKRPLPVEPQYPPLDIEPPEDISDAAKVEWNRLGPELIRNKVLTMADLSLFRTYCVAYSESCSLQSDLGREGSTMDTRNGPQRNPKLLALGNWHAILKDCWTKLGLSPVDRPKLGTSAQESEEELDEFAKEYGG